MSNAGEIRAPYPVFYGLDAKPLDGGYIYIGTDSLDPETNPILVYWDEAMTIPASQPIRTQLGVSIRAGSPASFWSGATKYSITVKDSKGQVVFSRLSTSNNDINYLYVLDILQDTLDPANGDALVAVKQPFTGAADRTQHEKNQDTVSLSDFDGCDPTGATNSDAAFASALARGGMIQINPGTYKIVSPLNVDISIVGFAGCGNVIIDASGIPSGHAINIYSSQGYGVDAGTKTMQNKVSGITFKGNTSIDGVLFGNTGASYTQSHDILVENCQFYTFKNGAAFTDNAWRSRMVRCGFEDISTLFVWFDSPSNAGECMTFDGCYFCNGIYGAGFYLNNGQWHFNHCSFPAGGDAGKFEALGAALLNINQCNIETQPQSADHVLVSASGASIVNVKGCTILTNETDYSIPYFECNDGARLNIIECLLPLYESLATEADAGVRALVKGTSSRVSLARNQVYGNGGTTPTLWAVASKAANAIFNGDAEVNSVAMWAVSAGGTGTFTNVTTSPKTGIRHYRANSPGAGSYAEAEQKFSVSNDAVGRTIIMGFWVKQTAGTGFGAFPSINFYTQNGTLISTYAAIGVSNTISTYTWLGQSTQIPAGTSIVGIKIGANDLGAGGCTVDYDDIVVNVI